ncbi:MAG: polymer-forming cytoskeletal protein [Chrysiogenia bacterium]
MNIEINPTGATMQNQRIADNAAASEQKSSISKATTITGEISGKGELRLDNQMNGVITLKGLLIIGRDGNFSGRVEADHIIVEGRVEGRIKALDKIEIRAGGHVQGKIVCQQIAIAEGAFLDGEVKSRKGSPIAPDYFIEKRKDLQSGNK